MFVDFKKTCNFALVIMLGSIILLAGFATTQVHAAGDPVTIRETGDTYATLEKAVNSAQGLPMATIEISGDTFESEDIYIRSNIAIMAVDGNHTVNMSGSIFLDNGRSLTLGGGSTENVVTFLGGQFKFTNGTFLIQDGFYLNTNKPKGIELSGNQVSGSITGGTLEATENALDISKGVQIEEISGGTFLGGWSAVHLSDAGSRIHEISGGTFKKTVGVAILRAAFFVQDDAQIDLISGGRFEAVDNPALILIRGGWVEEISGGEMIQTFQNTGGVDTTYTAVFVGKVETGWTTTGIGTISGGTISGSRFGLLVTGVYASDTVVRHISGGTITGSIGLQNDMDSVIGKISGGTITGISYGILNVSEISEITGDAQITSVNNYGIWNYGANSKINVISGGTIESTNSTAIVTAGTIYLISDGTFIGYRSALEAASLNTAPKKIDTITGGTFWGKTKTAIILSNTLKLEPGLTTEYQGTARFWGNNGVIFNNEDFVQYPDSYHMSALNEAIPAFSTPEFKYLTRTYTITYLPNEGIGSMVPTTGEYKEEVVISENTFANGDVKFLGWNTAADGKGQWYSNQQLVVMYEDITLYAQWKPVGVSPVDPAVETTDNNSEDKSDGNSGPSLPQTGFSGFELTILGLILAVGGCVLLYKQKNDLSE